MGPNLLCPSWKSKGEVSSETLKLCNIAGISRIRNARKGLFWGEKFSGTCASFRAEKKKKKSSLLHSAYTCTYISAFMQKTYFLSLSSLLLCTYPSLASPSQMNLWSWQLELALLPAAAARKSGSNPIPTSPLLIFSVSPHFPRENIKYMLRTKETKTMGKRLKEKIQIANPKVILTWILTFVHVFWKRTFIIKMQSFP